MRRARGGMSPFTAGLIALAIVLVAVYFGFTKSNPLASPYTLKAAFETSADLKKGSPVRIAGVNVGRVTAVEQGDENGEGSVVTMEINDNGLPIREDASATVRPRIFLEGNYFVDLRPGSPTAPEMEEDSTIPATRTAAPVQFGEVLQALQSDTRRDLQVLLQEYGAALDDGGAEGYNRSIQYQEDAFKYSAIVNEALLGRNDGDLAGYIRGAARVAEGLDRNRGQLRNLITDFAEVADALASEDTSLTAAIRELPETLEVGQRAFAALNTAFPPFRRLIADLRPATRSSEPALRVSIPLARQLRGLFSNPELRGLVRDLRPAIPDLVELNVGGVPLQRELRLLSNCQNEVVLPTGYDTLEDPDFPATGRVFQESVKWLPGIAGESRNFDANSQYVRSFVNTANFAYPTGDGRIFFSGSELVGVNPPPSPMPPLRPDVPCETQEAPDLRSRPADAPQQARVNQTSPAARARETRAFAEMHRTLTRQFRSLGWDVPVRRRPLSRAELGRAGGNLRITQLPRRERNRARSEIARDRSGTAEPADAPSGQEDTP